MIILMMAMSNDGVIGHKGILPWRNKEELRFFKGKTTHEIVVMGRKTYEGLENKPLPLRTNIVLTRDKDYVPEGEGVIVCHSPEEVVAFYEEEGKHNLYVCGGKEVYEAFKPYYTHAVISTVEGNYLGDTEVNLKDFIGNSQSYHVFYGDGFKINYYEVKK